MKTIDHTIRHRIISAVRDLGFPGTGTLSSMLSSLLLPPCNESILLQTLHGFPIMVNPGIDKGVERSLYRTGTYEKGIMRLMEQLLKPGDTFVDVGANIGLMTLHASRLTGPNGKVIAFEANPDTFQILEENMRVNQVKNVLLSPLALGSETGTARIYRNWHKNRGSASLVKPVQNESDSIDISVIPFDRFEPKPQKTDMIKMDIEGYELEALKGFSSVLHSDCPPILIVECTETNADEHRKSLYDYIKSCAPYRVFRLKNGKEKVSDLVVIHDHSDLPKDDNIICIPPCRMEKIQRSLFA